MREDDGITIKWRLVAFGQTMLKRGNDFTDFDDGLLSSSVSACMPAKDDVPTVAFTSLEGWLGSGGFEDETPDETALFKSLKRHKGTPYSALPSLKALGFNLIAMANNHSFDGLKKGVLSSLTAAEKMGVSISGIGADMESASQATVLEIKPSKHSKTSTFRVAMVSIATGALPAGAQEGGVSVLKLCPETGAPDLLDAQRCLQAIREARTRVGRQGLVVCSHHNHQYDGQHTIGAIYKESPLGPPREPSPWVKSWINQMVSAGLDVYLGSGDPQFLGFGLVNGKPCFYGLGSFCFQIREEGKAKFGHEAFEGITASLSLVEGADGARSLDIAVSAVKIDDDLNNGPHYGLPHRYSLTDREEASSILIRFISMSRELGADFSMTRANDGSQAALINVPL